MKLNLAWTGYQELLRLTEESSHRDVMAEDEVEEVSIEPLPPGETETLAGETLVADID